MSSKWLNCLLLVAASLLNAQAPGVRVVSRQKILSDRPDPVTGGPLAWQQATDWSADGLTIAYTEWTGSTFAGKAMSADGSNRRDLDLATAASRTAGTACGGVIFAPTNDWLAFQCQQNPGQASIWLPPGNSSNYDVFVARWTGSAVSGSATMISGANTATLWPRWATDGNRISYAKMYGTGAAGALFKIFTVSFNRTSGGVTPVGAGCEPQAAAGTYELGTFIDATNVMLAIQAGSGVFSQFDLNIYVLNTDTCVLTSQLNDPSLIGWDEFPSRYKGRLWFSRGIAQAAVAPNPFCQPSVVMPDGHTANTPCVDVVSTALGGYPSVGNSFVLLGGCNTPGDPLYLGHNLGVFCAINAVSPDGKKAILQRQTNWGREGWLITLSYPAVEFVGKIGFSGKTRVP